MLAAESFPEDLPDIFGYDGGCYWIKPLKAWQPKGYLYLGGPWLAGEESEPLAVDAIKFGIVQADDVPIAQSFKITDGHAARYEVYEGNCVGGVFTLISDDTESYRWLIGELRQWLLDLPLAKGGPRNARALAEEFIASINRGFVERV